MAKRKLRIKQRPVDSLIPYARNARTHSDEQVAQIAASIREFGWTNPILVDGKNGIIAGHGRVLAARSLGEAKVPCIELAGLSESETRAYILADNKLAENAGWDDDLLRLELGELSDKGFDLSLVGFDDLELQGLLSGGAEGLTDPDDAPELPADPITVVGDLWACGRHRVLCGDATSETDVEHLLGGVVPDIVVTSPPYNQGIDKFKPSGMQKGGAWVQKVARLAYADSMPEADYQQWQRSLLDIWHNILRDGGSVFYNHKIRYRNKQAVTPYEWLPGPFTLRQEIVWRHPSITLNARMFIPQDERIYWMYKGDDFAFDDSTEIKSWSTVWDVGNEINGDHAVAFPTELPKRCIRACTKTGESILDPFLGSGTTMIAAEMEGRACLGLEIAPEYCDVIVRRWQDFAGEAATLESDGRTFDKVAKARSKKAA